MAQVSPCFHFANHPHTHDDRLAVHANSLTSVSRRVARHGFRLLTTHTYGERLSNPGDPLTPWPLQVFELPLQGPFQLSLALLGSLSVTLPSLALRGEGLAIQRAPPKLSDCVLGAAHHRQTHTTIQGCHPLWRSTQGNLWLCFCWWAPKVTAHHPTHHAPHT